MRRRGKERREEENTIRNTVEPRSNAFQGTFLFLPLERGYTMPGFCILIDFFHTSWRRNVSMDDFVLILYTYIIIIQVFSFLSFFLDANPFFGGGNVPREEIDL